MNATFRFSVTLPPGDTLPIWADINGYLRGLLDSYLISDSTLEESHHSPYVLVITITLTMVMHRGHQDCVEPAGLRIADHVRALVIKHLPVKPYRTSWERILDESVYL